MSRPRLSARGWLTRAGTVAQRLHLRSPSMHPVRGAAWRMRMRPTDAARARACHSSAESLPETSSLAKRTGGGSALDLAESTGGGDGGALSRETSGGSSSVHGGRASRMSFRNSMRSNKVLVMVSTNLANLCCHAVYSVLASFFPQEAKAKGLSDDIVGFIFAIFAAVIFVFSPFAGRMMTRYGKVWVYIWGISIVSISTILFSVASLLPPGVPFAAWCFAMRLAQGIGSAMEETAMYAIIADLDAERVSLYLGICENTPRSRTAVPRRHPLIAGPLRTLSQVRSRRGSDTWSGRHSAACSSPRAASPCRSSCSACS